MKAIALLLGLLTLSPLAHGLEVLGSIKPLSLIAAAITDGVTTPSVLLPPGVSPHDYALRPSDIRAVQEADLVIWVGPPMEPFLERPLSRHPHVLTLADALPLHHHEQDGEPEEEASTAGEEEHHHDVDTHLWLGPDQALAIAKLIAARLQELDPSQAARYRNNLATFQQRVTRLDSQIARRMASLQPRGYFVFHDAYGYWERHYGLHNLGHFTLTPEQKPGARTLALIRQQLQAHKAVCVFAEPQFDPALLERARAGTQVRLGRLDPLGSGIPVSPSGYLELMALLADQFETCLKNG